MSVLRAVLVDFKANCKIENRIIKAKKKEEKKFMIYLYCLEQNIVLDREKNYLNLLYKKHELSWLHYRLPEVTKILSAKNLLINFYFYL